MNTTNELTAETITDNQIEALERDAATSGDLAQVALCRVALASALDDIADVGDQRNALERLGVIPEHVDADVRARKLCADAISSARAQIEVA